MVAVALALVAAGCGSGPHDDAQPEEQQALAVGISAGALSGDLVPIAGGQNDDPNTDPNADPEVLSAPPPPGSGGAPKVFFLHYADGRTLPRSNPDPCQDRAPRFACDFASNLTECQKQVQGYLDRWYADFNIVFTLTRPTSGAFYTEVVSSGGGAWCDAAPNVAGVAPFLCDDLDGGVAYTFRGGNSAKETAIIIAQEHAHLVGLEHTLSTRDIMDPTVCPDCDGFENVDNPIQNDRCGRSRQNSYKMMRDRLGAWTGGIKPTPFACQDDRVTPLVQILAPADNATVANNFMLRVQASDDCKVTRVTVAVAPMGLTAQSTAAPFEWTLTKISGRQTITVTAIDASGKQSTSSVTVNAPGAAGLVDGGPGSSDGGAGGEGAGCDVAGCGVAGRASTAGGAAWWFSLAALAAMIAILLGATRRAGAVARVQRRSGRTPSA